MRLRVQSLPLLSGLTMTSVAVSCGVGCGRGLDPALLWLWPVATAPIRSLAWELPYASGVALKKDKEKKKRVKEAW